MNVGLEPVEKQVLGALGNAWDVFINDLSSHHPDDIAEFRRAINAAQNIMAYRVARRLDPDVWSLAVDSPSSGP